MLLDQGAGASIKNVTYLMDGPSGVLITSHRLLGETSSEQDKFLFKLYLLETTGMKTPSPDPNTGPGRLMSTGWKCLPVTHVRVSLASSAGSVTSSQRRRHEEHLALLAEQQQLEKQQLQQEHKLQRKHLEQKRQLLSVQEADENQSVRSRRTVHSRTSQWVNKHADIIPECEEIGAVGGILPQQDAHSSQVNGNQWIAGQDPSESQVVRDLHNKLKQNEADSRQQIEILQKQLEKLQIELQKKAAAQTTSTTIEKGAISKHRPALQNMPPVSLRQSNPIDWEISPVETGTSKPVVTEQQLNRVFRGQVNVGAPMIPTIQDQKLPTVDSEQQRDIPTTAINRDRVQKSITNNPVQNRPTPERRPGTMPQMPLGNQPRSFDFPPPVAHHGNLTRITLSPEQLTARQVLPRDLPVFSGDPADWPVFISNYNYTTEACGYSEGENMIRLQRCLKGTAWESVRSRLILPASVPQVIESLRMRFGRADLLIESLIEKVRSSSALRADKLDTLIEFGTLVQGLRDHIIAAELLEHLENPTLLKDLVNKLPVDYKMKWASYRRHAGAVNLETFSMFMAGIVEDAYSVSTLAPSERPPRRDKQHSDRSYVHNETDVNDLGINQEYRKDTRNVSEIVCSFCRQPGHRTKECTSFLALTVDERWKQVHNQGLCRTCLFGHGRRTCRSTNRCGVDGCYFRHHPLLHSPTSISQHHQAVEHNVHQQEIDLTKLFFRIIPVTLHGPTGSIDTFAFLDEGSSLTMIETSLANKLGIDGQEHPLCLKWTGNITREEKKSCRIALEISGLRNKKRYWMSGVGTVPSLDLPVQTLPIQQLRQRYTHLRGVPIDGYLDAVQRLLIGIDNLRLALPLIVREGEEGHPVAVKTRLGWCIYGGHRDGRREPVSFHICECEHGRSMEETITAYFATEEVGARPVAEGLSKEEQRALQILQQTTIHVGTRYESGLLWRYDHFELPDSYPMAFKRLQCLQRRMNKDPVLKEEIHRQIQEYIRKGYAHRATTEELASIDPRKQWFLPLGAVVNPKKPSKVRLIWDGSAKVDGISLNSMLLKGPDQLSSLPAVVFRFRQHKVAVVGDIKEMYHQIRISKSDRYAQCFLWSSDSSPEPQIMVMDVATFGATSSPATAQFVKNTNAMRFVEIFPRAVDGIIHNHYVDDYLDSFPDEEQAKRVATEVRDVHQKGGFEIRNWCSNSKAVLEHLGTGQEKPVKCLNLENNIISERVLGMLWRSEEDVICFETAMRANIRILIEMNIKRTKRQILQCVMTLFDPLGLLAPYLIFGKILIQDVWRAGIGWDEQVDDDTFKAWQKWVNIIRDIDQVQIPRCYFRNPDNYGLANIQLHIFVDASPLAYSCACYFRIINAKGEVEVALVAAKAKVAPLKPMSVPRLELQACVLGTRMLKLVMDGHTIPVARRYFWTDSTTAYTWIHKDPHRYRPFVAHRVGEILESTKRDEWRWIRSKMNSADEATKWGVGPHFDSSSSWFSGPKFLQLPENQWILSIPTEKREDEELRACHVHQEQYPPEMIVDVKRFSSWNKLRRATGYVHRFLSNIRKLPTERCTGHLTQNELQQAERALFKLTQREAYSEEVIILGVDQKSKPSTCNSVPKSSSLYQLNPKIDQYGVLRVDGRIGAAKRVPYSVKHPVILPRKHYVTKLILEDMHRKFLHGNHETVVNEARQNFYIPQLRREVRSVVSQCQFCRIRKARPVLPQMAPLPEARLSPFIRPFTYTGVDYFGPVIVKIGRSNVKRWIALYTCLTIRAIHVELVHSLTTEAFVMSLRRFVGRRGAPLELHSDNGTNFHGAERILREQIYAGLAATFTNTNTTWHFIPPGAPHMGGSWERMVRSVKSAISSAYVNEKLDDEALQTLLIEAESIVNSRPLTQPSARRRSSNNLLPVETFIPKRAPSPSVHPPPVQFDIQNMNLSAPPACQVSLTSVTA
ncbi:uncharacterized protein LOC134290888 [Aedes albopictus]|uniref:Integrase catalytic domain-containing protein n=1 Tax=Aedes albopictus TaxID=7160 RepID=A0ABM1Y3F8_AEDAL